MAKKKITEKQRVTVLRLLRKWSVVEKKYRKAQIGFRRTKVGGSAWNKHGDMIETQTVNFHKINDKLEALGFKHVAHATSYMKRTSKRRKKRKR